MRQDNLQASRGAWAAATMAVLALIYGWNHWFIVQSRAALFDAQLSYGVGFVLFAVALLGALARFRVTPYPAFWRMLMLLVGAVAAGLEIALHGYGKAYFFPLWASALIGVAAVSVVARRLPKRLLTIWFGGEFEQ